MPRLVEFHSQAIFEAAARFGDCLRRACKAQKRTQAGLEQSSRVHRQTITRLERGDPTVSLGVALTVLESLDELPDLALLVARPDKPRPRSIRDEEPLDPVVILLREAARQGSYGSQPYLSAVLEEIFGRKCERRSGGPTVAVPNRNVVI